MVRKFFVVVEVLVTLIAEQLGDIIFIENNIGHIHTFMHFVILNNRLFLYKHQPLALRTAVLTLLHHVGLAVDVKPVVAGQDAGARNGARELLQADDAVRFVAAMMLIEHAGMIAPVAFVAVLVVTCQANSAASALVAVEKRLRVQPNEAQKLAGQAGKLAEHAAAQRALGRKWPFATALEAFQHFHLTSREFVVLDLMVVASPATIKLPADWALLQACRYVMLAAHCVLQRDDVIG